MRSPGLFELGLFCFCLYFTGWRITNAHLLCSLVCWGWVVLGLDMLFCLGNLGK